MKEYLLFGSIGAMFIAYLLVIVDAVRLKSRIKKLEEDAQKVETILLFMDGRLDLHNKRLGAMFERSKQEVKDGSDEN